MSRSSWGSKSRTDRANVWRLRYWRDTPDGRKRVTEMFHGTRREADDRLAELRVQYGKAYGGSMTVAQVYERLWLPDAAERVRAGTLRNYDSVWRKHVAPRWAGVPCDQVRPLDVQAWLTGGAMTHDRASLALQVLRGELDVAVMYELADHNASAGKFRLPSEAAHLSHDILHGDAELRAYAVNPLYDFQFIQNVSHGLDIVLHMLHATQQSTVQKYRRADCFGITVLCLIDCFLETFVVKISRFECSRSSPEITELVLQVIEFNKCAIKCFLLYEILLR